MKRTTLLVIVFTLLAMISCTQTSETVQTETSQKDYFQLKIFSFETPEQEATLDAYFQNALLPALHRANIENVGVFKPIEDLNERNDFTLVLIPYHSLDQFEQTPAMLEQDPAYQEAGEAYINAAHDQAPYTRIESMILRAFSATPHLMLPKLTSDRKARVYELRSYEGATEKFYKLKVEMFNEGESALFQELEFNPVFFCEVLSSAHMPHLMYMTTHADTTAQKENWDTFVSHPEWDRMKNLDRYQNTVSGMTRYLLYPTAYSDY
jgi:NIPSNAP